MKELRYEFPEALDNTMRTAWDTCQRKFLLEHIHALRHTSPSIHLVFGAAYAKGLEVIRHEFYNGNKNKVSYMVAGFKAAMREWESMVPGDTMEEEIKSLTNMLCALMYYVETWPLATDWIRPLVQNDKPAIEFTFALPIQNYHPETHNPLLYAGRFDMFADYATEPAVYDDKTATQLGGSWVSGWAMDSQLTGYIWAGSQHGFNCSVAIIRGVSILKHGNGHAQAIEHRQNWEVQRWYDTLEQNAEDMLKAYMEHHFIPSLGQGCKAYGGCPYITLCKQHNWEDWIDPEFHEHVWNPLDIHKVKEKQDD